MSIKEISFLSANGRDTIQAWRYSPLQEPKGIIQVVHGFGEHSRRYLHMIATFQEAGFVVVADDHLAHGKTAQVNDSWGDPGDKGFMVYIEDEHKLRDIAVEEYPDLPYFMFGHSWGSMIARGYGEKYGQELKALTLCGLVCQMEGCEKLKDDNTLRALVESGKGPQDGTQMMGGLFEGVLDHYENPTGPNDWIACDPRVVADHAADPFNNMKPTIQLLYDFEELYKHIHRPEWARNIPAQLPVYIIAGDQDPCGNYGEGPYHLANELFRCGNRTVKVHVYTGYRHEIHNELSIRDEVEQGVVEFFEDALK